MPVGASSAVDDRSPEGQKLHPALWEAGTAREGQVNPWGSPVASALSQTVRMWLGIWVLKWLNCWLTEVEKGRAGEGGEDIRNHQFWISSFCYVKPRLQRGWDSACRTSRVEGEAGRKSPYLSLLVLLLNILFLVVEQGESAFLSNLPLCPNSCISLKGEWERRTLVPGVTGNWFKTRCGTKELWSNKTGLKVYLWMLSKSIAARSENLISWDLIPEYSETF